MRSLPASVLSRPTGIGFIQTLAGLWRVLVQTLWPDAAEPGATGSRGFLRRFVGTPARVQSEAARVTTQAPDGHHLLGVVTAADFARLLEDRGVLGAIRERGYERLEVVVEASSFGSRARVFGQANRQRQLLVELVVERRSVAGRMRLYIQWLLLQHPAADFRSSRPALPGQEAPGLGVSSRLLALLAELAKDLGLAGIAYRPSWYHVAYRMSRHFVFADPARQERFEALQQSLAHLSLAKASQVVHEGRARLNDEPYTWEPDQMVERPSRVDEPAPRERRVVVSTNHVRHRHDRDPRPHGAL